jgi:hypothetical protein
MAALIIVAERLHALQAGNIAFSETNVEWHTFQLRYNMQKINTKAFGLARLEYITTSYKFETTYHKPGGTASGALGQMVHYVVDTGRDETGCGRWSYLAYAAKEGKKVAIGSVYIVCKHTNHGDLTLLRQKLEIIYEDEELCPFLVDLHKQALIDLQYFVDELQENGHDVKVSQSKEIKYEPRTLILGYVFRRGLWESGNSGNNR